MVGALEAVFFEIEKEGFVYEGRQWVNQVVVAKKI